MPAAVASAIDVPLPLAAHQLGISWQQAWRAMLVGQLAGVKKAGRWYVTAASVAALAARLAQGGAV